MKFSEAVTGVSRSSFRLVDSNGKTDRARSLQRAHPHGDPEPASTRKANAPYTVRLSNTIQDAAGNRLAATNWSFRTGR